MVKSHYLVEFPAQKREPKWFQNLWCTSTVHFDKEIEFQFLGPGVTVLSFLDPSTFGFDHRSGRRSPSLHWAGRRWICTFKRRFGILGRRLPLDEPVSADHVQAKAGSGPILGTLFWPLSRRILFETTMTKSLQTTVQC